MAHFTLEIDLRQGESEERGPWIVRSFADGAPLADEPLLVEGKASAAVRALGRSFLELFEKKRRPIVPASHLAALGRTLRETFLPQLEERIAGAGTGRHRLSIVSKDGVVLNLPWELIELSEGLPLGCDAGWSLVRGVEASPPGGRELRPGPLRLLFLAAAPTDQDQLDYEREEDGILEIVGRLRKKVVLRFAETGS